MKLCAPLFKKLPYRELCEILNKEQWTVECSSYTCSDAEDKPQAAQEQNQQMSQLVQQNDEGSDKKWEYELDMKNHKQLERVRDSLFGIGVALGIDFFLVKDLNKE